MGNSSYSLSGQKKKRIEKKIKQYSNYELLFAVLEGKPRSSLLFTVQFFSHFSALRENVPNFIGEFPAQWKCRKQHGIDMILSSHISIVL